MALDSKPPPRRGRKSANPSGRVEEVAAAAVVVGILVAEEMRWRTEAAVPIDGCAVLMATALLASSSVHGGFSLVVELTGCCFGCVV